jgi:hypothetical protein
MPPQNDQSPGAFDLFSRFTHLRQTGLNRDDAWYRVCDGAPDITMLHATRSLRWPKIGSAVRGTNIATARTTTM